MRNRFIAVVAFCLGLCACNPESLFNQVEPVDFGAFESKLVPNYFLNNLNQTGIAVSHTVPVVGPQAFPNFISDATVQLYENDVLLETVPFSTIQSDSAYRPTTLGVPGKYYRIEVRHPKYKPCIGVDTMPQVVPFTATKTGKVRYIKESFLGQGSGILDTFIEVSIKFTDPPGENFYRIAVSDSAARLGVVNNTSLLQFAFDRPISTDVVFNSTTGFDPLEPKTESYVSPNDDYFTDATFNNSVKEVSIWFPIGNFSTIVQGGIPEEFWRYRLKRYFALQHLSKTQYLRVVSAQQVENNGNPFAQPSLLFTNTSGGYGIMACSSSSVDSVSFK